MRAQFLAVALLTLLLPVAFGAENITVDYTYTGDHRVNFSNIPRGPLKVAEFSDARTGIDPNLISDGAGGFMADKPLAQIVQNALVQGFLKGNAALVDSGENLTLAGSVVASEAQVVDSNGVESIQLTIRTRVQLQGSGRTLWESVLFGRGTSPVADGIMPALNEALERTIRGLVQDDYFLNEVL